MEKFKLILEDFFLVQEAVTGAGLILHQPEFSEFCYAETLLSFLHEILFVKIRSCP